MKRFSRNTWLALAFHVGGRGCSLLAADAPAPVSATAPVELPPMMVEESTSSVPWLYVNAGGTEFLSRCSAVTTRELVEAWLEKLQLARVLVPEEFLGRTEVPTIFVLYTQASSQSTSAEIQRQLQAERAGIAPSMRLTDRDTHATIAFIDETKFNASTLSVSANHIRYLLRSRVPELPLWLVEGLERLWLRADFLMEPVTLGPLVWNNPAESDALASDATRPRAVFWNFAARAAEIPVTEEMFEASFGFGFSELRDRLSDYLPAAVEESVMIRPGDLPPRPRVEVRRATANEIARVRGEWERLAIGHVQRRLPQVREPYIAQARRTVRRAYDSGDRDPRLLATMGLCEIDAGNPAGAIEFLEPAIAMGVIRPRAGYELASLRFADLRRKAPDNRLFSFTELAPIFEPLHRAASQSPPLPEVFALLGEAWARCEAPPSTAEFAELEKGARLFGRRATVGYPLALALARHGRKTEAFAVLEASAGDLVDEIMRAEITRLRAELASSSSTSIRSTTEP